jgi:hypothetical protein
MFQGLCFGSMKLSRMVTRLKKVNRFEDGRLLGCSAVLSGINFYQNTRRYNPAIFVLTAVITSNPS